MKLIRKHSSYVVRETLKQADDWFLKHHSPVIAESDAIIIIKVPFMDKEYNGEEKETVHPRILDVFRFVYCMLFHIYLI